MTIIVHPAAIKAEQGPLVIQTEFKGNFHNSKTLPILKPKDIVPGKTVLASEKQILDRIDQLAEEIVIDSSSKKPDDRMFVTIENGAEIFSGELQKAMYKRGLSKDTVFDTMRLRSRKNRDSGDLEFDSYPKNEHYISGRDIFVVEDIIDSGKTLAGIIAYFIKMGARSITTVSLISKPHKRLEQFRGFNTDYTGFELVVDADDPDADIWTWVEGHGMDTMERGRINPDIIVGSIREELERRDPSIGLLALSIIAAQNVPVEIRGTIYSEGDELPDEKQQTN